jgi:hypothetical protein
MALPDSTGNKKGNIYARAEGVDTRILIRRREGAKREREQLGPLSVFTAPWGDHTLAVISRG